MVRRVGNTRSYEPTSTGLKAMAALLVLRDKIIKPLLAASMEVRPTHGGQNPTTLDKHYETIRVAMQGAFRELGLGRVKDRQLFSRASPSSAQNQ